MKRGIKRSHKSKIFNFLNIILIALLFVELTFVVDSEITGNPIKSVIKKAVAVESSFGKINIVKTASCIPSKEICDKKDNDCDKLVDEGGVCKSNQINNVISNSQSKYSLELDIPSYLDQSLSHPKKFFSGRKIRIVKKEGNEISSKQFPSIISLIKRDPFTKNTISGKSIEVTKYRKDFFGFEIPGKIETGDYFIDFSANGNKYSLPINIQGLSELERSQISQQSSITQSQIFPWIYRTSCNNYWESVSGINPHNENYGYVGAGTMLAQTKDGWETSICYGLDSQTNNQHWISFGDLKMAFMDGGTPVISTLMFKSGEPITGGILKDSSPMNYPVNFTQINLVSLPSDLSPEDWIIFDYEKVSIDTYNDSPYYGNIYVFANAVNLGPEYNPRFGQGIFIVKPDGSISKKIKSMGSAVTSTLVGPDGKVYIAQPDLSGPMIGVSLDGGENYTYYNIVDFNRDGGCYGARLSTNSNRSWHIYKGPEIALDNNGIIYAVWANWETCVEDPDMEYGFYSYNYDVFVSKSLDSGITWSQPVKVNNDNTKTDQGFPSIKIDKNGDAYIAFLDRRNTQDVSEFDVFIAKSIDRGLTFSNVKVNDISVPNAYGGRNPGDYLDMVSVGETKVFVSHPCVHPAFPPIGGPTDVCVAKLPKLGSISCTDTDNGQSIYTKGTVTSINLSGSYSYTDYCVSSTYVKEYYCQNNQALSANLYCSKGCLSYNGACTRPTSTGCYTDPKTKKKVCPAQLT